MKKAMYRRRVVYAGCTVDVSETYPTQFGDSLTRERASNIGRGSPEAMKRYNAELAARRLAQILNENFVPDDIWATFTYEKDNRPESYKAACEVMSGFTRKLRRLYDKYSVELKYVKATAYGERGALHHHLVIPQGVPKRAITSLWREHIGASEKGHPPYYVELYPDGDYSGLAAYIVDQVNTDYLDDRYIKKWICSRNIKKPVEAVEDIEEIKWSEPPEAWDGYTIDTYSIKAGTNEITGRPYLFYRMVKIRDELTVRDDNGKLLRGAEAAQYIRRKNIQYIRDNWCFINDEGEVVFLNELNERQDE